MCVLISGCPSSVSSHSVDKVYGRIVLYRSNILYKHLACTDRAVLFSNLPDWLLFVFRQFAFAHTSTAALTYKWCTRLARSRRPIELRPLISLSCVVIVTRPLSFTTVYIYVAYYSRALWRSQKFYRPLSQTATHLGPLYHDSSWKCRIAGE